MISVLATGWLADRVGRKIILFASSILIGGASVGFASFSNDFNSILFWRVLVGIGCGGVYAPGLAYLSSWFPARERGMAFGAYTGAAVTAYAGGYLIAAPIAAMVGWKVGIIATSFPVFIAALVFSLLPDEPELDLRLNGDSKSIGVKEMKKLSLLSLALLILAYMAHVWEQFAFFGWAGRFL